MPNARLRGWQRITLNSNATTVTTAAQWDWKRHALTVPLEAFVMFLATMYDLSHKPHDLRCDHLSFLHE
ncbi:hypothetical protein DLR71_11370 [Vibrio paracholerae]|nr:hypothetical protein DLR71_11370 [Vibrio paracholerae]